MDLSWPEHGTSETRGAIIDWIDDDGGMHKGECLATVPGMDVHVIKCSPCVLNHIIPLPSEAWLSRYYQEFFYQRAHPDYCARYDEDAHWWRLHHSGILSQVARALYPRPLRGAYSILDVGCGPGLLLDAAQEAMGWHTVGYEPCPALHFRLRARGHTLLPRFPDPDGPRYDCVTLYEVLEHERNPETMLLDCHAQLKDGGVLVVVVPNDFNPWQYRAMERHVLGQWWISPPEHLHYFTPKTLQLLLRRCGFSLLDMHGTFPMEGFMLTPWQGWDKDRVYVGNDTLGRQCHRERMAWEMQYAVTWRALIQYYRTLLNDYRIGREIVAYARKI